MTWSASPCALPTATPPPDHPSRGLAGTRGVGVGGRGCRGPPGRQPAGPGRRLLLAGLDARVVKHFPAVGASSIAFDGQGNRLLLGGLERETARLWGRVRRPPVGFPTPGARAGRLRPRWGPAPARHRSGGPAGRAAVGRGSPAPFRRFRVPGTGCLRLRQASNPRHGSDAGRGVCRRVGEREGNRGHGRGLDAVGSSSDSFRWRPALLLSRPTEPFWRPATRTGGFTSGLWRQGSRSLSCRQAGPRFTV